MLAETISIAKSDNAFQSALHWLQMLLQDPLTIFLVGLSLLILFFWYFATELEKRKRNIGTVLFIGLTALCLTAIIPPQERLKGGIDIVGGSAFTLRVQPKEGNNGEKLPITREQIEQAIIVIEKRLNGTGTAEPLITQQGADGILVQMPGIDPETSNRIRKILETVAKLELHKVSELSEQPGANGKTLADRVLNEGELAVGQRAYILKGKDGDGNAYQRPILLNRRAALGGSDISNAVASPQQNDAVAITLNDAGTDKMIALTQNMKPQVDRIAVVLDGEVISAPTVNSVPLGRQFIIEGLREPGEVQRLANQLMNPLENPLKVEEMRNISPTLGKAVVHQGLFAGILAFALTFVFMLVYYRFSGFLAIVALTINAIMLFGLMAMFGFTFSLPGIAGIILTSGMAVDANVLIYERLREELAAGKSLKLAIDAAYDKAFSAIFDSHVTSLITAIILFGMGSGTIKGFAVTLIIGLTASMFTAILCTRVLYRWGMDFNLIKKLTFMHLIKSAHYDFMGKRRIYATLAVITVIISLAAFAVKRERCLGIDFTGGTRIMFQMGDAKFTLDEVDGALKNLKLSKIAYPQQESHPTTGSLLTVRCATEDAKPIIEKLRETIPALGTKAPDKKNPDKEVYVIDASTEEVSAVIGGSFMVSSLVAIGLGLLGIVLYMTARFEFSFALGGFIAIFHDMIISVGVIVLMGQELSLIHVGAVLTIAGYSISDTIIVFDRIRETVLIRSGSIEKIMNEAINTTLSRTVITSGATLLSVLVMSAIGGSALSEFGTIIAVGIVVGTFSSIFIASPIVLWWSNHKGKSLRDQVLETAAKAEAVTAKP